MDHLSEEGGFLRWRGKENHRRTIENPVTRQALEKHLRLERSDLVDIDEKELRDRRSEDWMPQAASPHKK